MKISLVFKVQRNGLLLKMPSSMHVDSFREIWDEDVLHVLKPQEDTV